MTDVHLFIDGKLSKNDRLCANLRVPMSGAKDILERVFTANELYITGDCDIRSAFKEMLDEDIPAVSVVSAIHVPTVHRLMGKKRDAGLLLFPMHIVLTVRAGGRRTRVQALDPSLRGLGGDEGLEAAGRKAKKILRKAFKEMERQANNLAKGVTGQAESASPRQTTVSPSSRGRRRVASAAQRP